jgi:aspartate carbamoyltransferase
MAKESVFRGRTIAVVRDLSIDEQKYLYQKTKELKKSIKNNKDISSFIINDKSIGIYLIFLEDSTRTKESFRNAALFHKTKLMQFDAEHSSFNKKESYADTIRMLSGYSKYSIFILRSKLEGVCRWLDIALAEYAQRQDFLKPAFINAGDGKHEHPTQEFLDEYSFYERKNFSYDHIHIALIGDLFHGRTTHSKADGLKIFKNVEIDLIAPPDLAMPEYYKTKMSLNKFFIREFESIDQYLAQNKIADIWYFTRLQLERMGEDIKEKAPRLRSAVIFRKEHLSKIPEGTIFYHPLPRHREFPTIPPFLDDTPLNGWEGQSVNGYFTRIIEIGMLAGLIGEDYQGKTSDKKAQSSRDFVIKVKPKSKPKPEFKVGIIPITNGIVIDHIGLGGDSFETIWEHINNIRKVLNLNTIGSHGVFHSERTGLHKGIMAIPNLMEFDRPNIKKLAAIAPGCTLNIIKNRKVIHKYRISMPPKIYNFKEISCKNPDCISHHHHHEHAQTIFYRSGESSFICAYCDHTHTFKEIWNL